MEVDDGVAFRFDQVTTRIIREQDVYAAVRVAMPASLATAALALKVDVNVGDPVTPAPVELSCPALLDQPFTMVGYPLVTVLAEIRVFDDVVNVVLDRLSELGWPREELSTRADLESASLRRLLTPGLPT